MCVNGTKMKAGTNEIIEYTALPLEVDGYDTGSVVSLCAEASVGSFRYVELADENFKVSRHDFRIITDTTLRLDLPDTAFLGLTFALENDITCLIAGLGESKCCRDQFNFLFLPRLRADYLFKKGLHTAFSVDIDRKYFATLAAGNPVFGQFALNIPAGIPSAMSPHGLYGDGEMLRIISMITAMMETRSLTRLLLEAKTRELIHLCMERIRASRFGAPVPLTVQEEQAMRKACDLLLANLNRHIAIADAADRFGISEKKLSKAFKSRNGIDLSGYILKERMELARYWLRQGKSVKETAKLTGYPSRQNLSAMFTKYFNENPRDVIEPRGERRKRRP